MLAVPASQALMNSATGVRPVRGQMLLVAPQTVLSRSGQEGKGKVIKQMHIQKFVHAFKFLLVYMIQELKLFNLFYR